MPNPSVPLSRSQLGRLLELILLLRAGRFPNASALAESFEVSRRTIYRDLHSLELGGVPVGYRADRGGYEISPGFFLESPRLEEDEAVALILQAMRTGPRTGPARDRAAYRALQKIVQALPEEFRGRLLALVEALRDRSDSPALDRHRSHIHEVLVAALARKQTLRIWIREPGTPAVVSTKLAPTRLTLEGDSWRVIGRSSLHRRVESLRVAWIVRAVETGESSPESRSGSTDRRSPNRKTSVRLRFDARLAPEILDGRWASGQQFEGRDDGSLDMSFPIDDAEALVGWILSLGEHVEVLGPASLRDRIREIARRVARIHAPAIDRIEANPLPREAQGCSLSPNG